MPVLALASREHGNAFVDGIRTAAPGGIAHMATARRATAQNELMVPSLTQRRIVRRVPLRRVSGAEQTMSMPASSRHWTIDEVRAMQDEERAWPRYELIDGELLVTPGPRRLHQHAVAELFRLLHPYVRAHAIGVVELSPADLQLEPGTIVQPDVFVSPLHAGRLPMHWLETTRLILAAEVISPSNARADRVTKRRFYARADVAEYWMIDLDARVIERNLGHDLRPEILDSELTWKPDGAAEPLIVDVPSFFARAYGEGTI